MVGMALTFDSFCITYLNAPLCGHIRSDYVVVDFRGWNWLMPVTYMCYLWRGLTIQQMTTQMDCWQRALLWFAADMPLSEWSTFSSFCCGSVPVIWPWKQQFSWSISTWWCPLFILCCLWGSTWATIVSSKATTTPASGLALWLPVWLFSQACFGVPLEDVDVTSLHSLMFPPCYGEHPTPSPPFKMYITFEVSSANAPEVALQVRPMPICFTASWPLLEWLYSILRFTFILMEFCYASTSMDLTYCRR